MTPARRYALVLFVLVWLSGAWFGSSEYNPNNATRLAAAISLVEDGDATIDEYDPVTIDKARFGEHVYMDKAPGMTLMAVPVVWLADRVSGDDAGNYSKSYFGDGIWRFLRVRLRLAAGLGTALLTALAAVALLSLGQAVGGSRAAGLVAALGFALGSPVWGWSTSLFGHAAVASLIVIALEAIRRATLGSGNARWAAVAGVAIGWSITVELQSVLWAAFLGPWALLRAWPLAARWRLIGAAAAGGTAALLPLLAYNWLAFGTPFHVGYSGVVGFEGMNRGLFGLGLPDAALIPRLLFGSYRGLFPVAPVLLAGVFGIAWLIRRPETRGLGLVAAGIAVTALLYNAAYYYWDGGHSTGPRHMIPAVGMLALGLAAVWPMLDTRRERVVFAGLLGISMALNLAIAAADVTAPDIYGFPLTDHILPLFAKGRVRTLGSEYLGWSGHAATLAYLLVALPLLGWLVRNTTTRQ